MDCETYLALELKLCYILGFYDAAQLYHKLYYKMVQKWKISFPLCGL